MSYRTFPSWPRVLLDRERLGPDEELAGSAVPAAENRHPVVYSKVPPDAYNTRGMCVFWFCSFCTAQAWLTQSAALMQ